MTNLLQSMTSGVSSQQLFLQLHVKEVTLSSQEPYSFSVAIFSGKQISHAGKQRQDGCSTIYHYEGNTLKLEHCVLNIYMSQVRKTNEFTIRLLPSEGEKQTAMIALFDVRPFVTEFLLQGTKRFLVDFPLSRQGSVLVAIFVNNNRVDLLEEVKLQTAEGKAVKKDLIIVSESEPLPSKSSPTSREILHRRIAIPRVIERHEDNKTETGTVDSNGQYQEQSSSRLRDRVRNLPKIGTTQLKPSWSLEGQESPSTDHKDEDFNGKEVESPLMKLLNSKGPLEMPRQGRKLGRAATDVIRIKRTDSIDEESEINKRRCLKFSMIGIAIFVLVFYLFVTLRKTTDPREKTPIKKRPIKSKVKSKRGDRG